MPQCKDVIAHLEAMNRVKKVLVLDAGQCVLLIFSTGGFSTYMPSQGITILAGPAEARVIADSYWQGTNFDRIMDEL